MPTDLLNFALCGLPLWAAPVLLLSGALAGLLAGLIGVGGGVVIVPVLSSLLVWNGSAPSEAIQVAIGTSLLTIIPSALASTRKHAQRDNVDWIFIRRWGPAIALGSFAGATIVGHGHANVAMASFAALCLLFSAYLLSGLSERGLWSAMPRGLAPVLGLGLGIGSWSGAAGVGGGLVSSALMTACAVPIRLAIGTSAGVGVLVALPGAAASLSAPSGSTLCFGNTAPGLALLLAVAQIPAAGLGAKLSAAAPTKTLKLITAGFALATGLAMMAKL